MYPTALDLPPLQIKLGDLLNRNVPALGELGGPSPFENLQAAYTIVAAYECSRQSMKWAEDNPRVAEAMADSIDHGSQVMLSHRSCAVFLSPLVSVPLLLDGLIVQQKDMCGDNSAAMRGGICA